MRVIRIAALIFVLIGFVALPACDFARTLFGGNRVQAQLQSAALTYGIRSVTAQELGIIQDGLNDGSFTMDSQGVGELIGCRAEQEDEGELDWNQNGAVGSSGSNGRFAIENMVVTGLGSPNAPCTVPTANLPDLEIVTAAPLAVGTVQDDALFELQVDGITYTNRNYGTYARFELETYTPGAKFGTGTFEFIGRNADDSNDLNVLIVKDGTFAVVH